MIRRLTAFLQHAGIEPLLTKQPTNAVRQSEIFRTYMDSPEHAQYEYRSLSLLAASDRVQHANKLILPALRQKKIVISDRYFYSCVANLRARGYEKDRWINEISAYIPKPDIAFFLDTPVSAAVARVRRRPEEKIAISIYRCNINCTANTEHCARKQKASCCQRWNRKTTHSI